MNKTTIKSRIFLVGCPRSGTTLLQTLLASHPEIISFPESHFFSNLLPENEPKRRLLGIASNRTKPRLLQFLRETGVETPEGFLPIFPQSVNGYTRKFVDILDALALEKKKSIWIEKTPKHLHYIELVEKIIPGVKFIHIVRNGADVVASIYDVSAKNKEWGGSRDIDTCINRWIGDVKITSKYLNKSNHIAVKYEELVENTQGELIKLCEFIGVDFQEAMLQDYGLVAKRVVLGNEPWKVSVSQPIHSKGGQKFSKVFDEEQKAYILKKVSEVNLL